MEKKIWWQEGKVITNGKEMLRVGDYVNFHPVLTTYRGKWRLLGVSKKGELELISDEPILNITIAGKTGYENGTNLLNQFCYDYGRTLKSIGGRSVNMTDIEKIIKDDELQEIIFGKNNYFDYWLNTECHNSEMSGSGYMYIQRGEIKEKILFDKLGNDYSGNHSLRPIVVLSKNVELFHEWEIK